MVYFSTSCFLRVLAVPDDMFICHLRMRISRKTYTFVIECRHLRGASATNVVEYPVECDCIHGRSCKAQRCKDGSKPGGWNSELAKREALPASL